MDFNDLLAKHTHKAGPVCTMRTMLDGLDPKTREQVQTALDAASINHRTLMRVFTEMGHKIGDSTISRHRRGECECAK